MKEKRFCTNCGKQLELDDKFCSKCGQLNETKEEIVVEIQPKKRGRKPKVVDVPEAEIREEKKEPEVEKPEIPPIEADQEKEYLKRELELLKQNKKEKHKKFIYPILSSLITFVLCLGAFSLFYNYYLKNLVIETTKREVTVTDTGISEAVDKVYDAVVVVESYSRGQLYSTGTGVVYKTDDNKGYILTNDHVIENASEVKVVFSNNTREEVKIVGSDSYSDIAVLSVDKDKIISVAEIGSSEDLKVGDTAFAVGAPLDSSTYAWTVTRGVISGKNRAVTVTSSNGYTSSVMEVLQTDTAINSGNSGGPLCNSNGQVIGITNMKLASSTIEGMGFAIPIETAVKNADTFITGGTITYPYLGVSVYTSLNRYTGETLGTFIELVAEDSPAEKAGLKAGDKVLKINDVTITSDSFFKYELYKHKIGEKVTITVERNGKEKEIEVTLGSSNTSA